MTKYAGPGIPLPLVFLDAEGKVLSDSYVNGSYVGPQKVLADIEKTLGPGSRLQPRPRRARPLRLAWEAVASARAPALRPSRRLRQGSNFDDFFKKKTPSQ